MDLLMVFKFAGALAIVLALIGLCAWIARRLELMPAIGPSRQKSERRLSIVESLTLDAKRRVVIIRKDDKEHLLLLGANNDTVIGTPEDAMKDSSQTETNSRPTIFDPSKVVGFFNERKA